MIPYASGIPNSHTVIKMAESHSTKPDNTTNMSATPPETAVTKDSTKKPEQIPLPITDFEDEDLDQDFPPIEPLPTPPPKKRSTNMPDLTATPEEVADIQRVHNVVSTPPAPGLRPVNVGKAAAENPPERPQNERINKVFQEQALKDLERKGAK